MTAVACYFGPEGSRLFGWFHHPTGPAHGPVAVICPPLGYDMVVSHRGVRHLAEGLAASGIPVLRFDYHGTGDSAGSDYEPGRVDAWLASVAAAIDHAKALTGSPQVALVGIRLGSLLALTAAARRDDVAAIVAWGPVATGRALMRELRAFEQIMTGDDPIPDEVPEGAVAAAGFIFTKESVEAVGTLDAGKLPKAPAPRALIIPRDDVPADDKMARGLTAVGVAVTVTALPGYAGMMRDAHATAVPEEAISGIVAWLQEGGPVTCSPVAPPTDPVLTGVASGAALMGVTLPGAAGAIRERPFRADGGRLFGILTEPLQRATTDRPAIILSNAGAVHRIGSNRIYVEFARALAERGFPVLRMDLGGLGDSPPAPGMEENVTYTARAVPDVAAAMDALRGDGVAHRFVVGGLCSGAHTAFHAALELEGLAGIVMLNPIVFYWKPSDSLDVAAWMTFQKVRRYKDNLKRPDAWGRVLSGQANYGAIVETLVQRLKDQYAARRSALLREWKRLWEGEPTGEHAPRDLRRMGDAGTDVLLLFSEGDPGLDFLRLNHAADLRRLRRHRRFVLEVVPHQGHTFTAIAAQRAVIGTVVRHLAQRFA